MSGGEEAGTFSGVDGPTLPAEQSTITPTPTSGDSATSSISENMNLTAEDRGFPFDVN